MSGEICYAIAAQDATEDTEMLRYALSKTDIGTGGEVKLASPGAFLLQEVEERAVVGQVGYVEFNVGSDERLEGGFAVDQRAG